MRQKERKKDKKIIEMNEIESNSGDNKRKEKEKYYERSKSKILLRPFKKMSLISQILLSQKKSLIHVKRIIISLQLILFII